MTQEMEQVEDTSVALETPEDELVIRKKETFDWYVIKTYGPEGIEEKVRDGIEKDIEDANIQSTLGRIIIPEEDVYEIKRGKKVTKTRKKFQGYIFIEMENTEEICHIILSQQYVSGFVGGGKENPCPMDDFDIERILEDHFQKTKPKPKSIFDVGETVKIGNGSFEGVEGKVKSIDVEKGKMHISIVIFGRQTDIELESWQVEKI
jgi:transcriptional antiterminator NusG